MVYTLNLVHVFLTVTEILSCVYVNNIQIAAVPPFQTWETVDHWYDCLVTHIWLLHFLKIYLATWKLWLL